MRNVLIILVKPQKAKQAFNMKPQALLWLDKENWKNVTLAT